MQALTLGLWMQWPGGPVDLKTYWPPQKLTGPQKTNWPLPQNQTCAMKKYLLIQLERITYVCLVMVSGNTISGDRAGSNDQ